MTPRLASGAPRLVLALVFTVAAALAATPRGAAAQDRPAVTDTTGLVPLVPTPAGQSVLLTLRDGSRLIGRIIDVTPTSLRFASSIGESTLPRMAVRSVRVVLPESLHGGEYWPENPSRTRLLFAPTGRMLRKGETYFSDAYVFFPSIQAGFTNSFTLGGGLSLFPGVGLDEQVYYLTPKLGILAGPRVNVAVGALVAAASFATDQSPFGIGYGVATFGGDDASVTVGTGFGFAAGDVSSVALLMLGGEKRVARSLSLISENYVLATGDGGGLASGGVRILGEHIAVDLALAVSNGGAAPYLSFIYKW